MTETGMKIGGAVTFWSLSGTTLREQLASRWEDAGFKDFIPPPPGAVAALHDALDDVLAGPRMMVRPLYTKDGWTVVEEQRGTEENKYVTILTAKLAEGSDAVTITPYSEAVPLILQKYRHCLLCLKPAVIGSALVRAVQSLGAASLRPNGGFYDVPLGRLDDWSRLALATEACGGHFVYLVRHIMDADAVRAIRDAVVKDVLSEAKRINQEIKEKELGERALKNRQALAQALREKVLVYEELLDMGLEGLHQAVSEAEEAAGRAALLVAAGVGDE